MKRLLLTGLVAGLVAILIVGAVFALRGQALTETAAAPPPVKQAQNGTNYSWNDIALPLVMDNVSTASDVANEIDPNGSIIKVSRWRSDIGQWETYVVSDPFSNDFSVSTGDALFVAADSNAPATASWVGDVPAQGSISYSLVPNQWNSIMIPLDQDGQFDMTASGLAANIGGVVKVSHWLNDIQQWETYIVSDPFSNDFPVRLGYPYFILTNDSPPANWP